MGQRQTSPEDAQVRANIERKSHIDTERQNFVDPWVIIR